MTGADSGVRAVGACILIMLFACSGEGRTTPSYVMDATTSGLPWARNSGEGGWGDSDRWTAWVGQMLGAVDGDGADVFGSVRALDIGPDGSLFVLDELAQDVRVFDSRGRHLRTFGRRGQGPGEFGYADGLSFDRDGALWVLDARPWRLSAFTAEGTFLRSLPVPPTGEGGDVLSEGAMLFWMMSDPDRDYSGLGGDVGSVRIYQPVKISLRDGVIDSLTPHEVEYPMAGPHRIPWSVEVRWAQDPRGPVWISHGSEYTLYKRTLEGDTLLVVSLEDAAPAPVTRPQADSIVEAGRSRLRSMNQILRSRSLPTIDEGFMDGSDLPSHRPIVERILVDGAGHVLVLPRLDGHDFGTIADVFADDTGEYLGRVELPVPVATGAPARLTVGRLWVVAPGEYDVPRIARIDLGPST